MENSVVVIRSAQQSDMPSLLGLIEGKAEFDGGRHLLRASASELEEAFFGASPGCEVLVADRESELLGFATYFQTFSTFLARPVLWLDDLFITPHARSGRIGKMFMRELARRAVQKGCGRIEWTVAASNERGISFYQREGAKVREDGRLVRLDADGLANLAST